MKIKKFAPVISLLAVTLISSNAFSQSQKGETMAHSQMKSEMAHHDAYMNDSWQQLSQEKKDQLEALHRQFMSETAQTRATIGNIGKEMRAVMESEQPDREKLISLVKQEESLQAELAAKNIDFHMKAKKVAPEYNHGSLMEMIHAHMKSKMKTDGKEEMAHHGAYMNDSWQQLSQEKKDQLEALHRQVMDETAKTKAAIKNTSNEMRTIMESAQPDKDKLLSLVKEQEALRVELAVKNIDFHLKAKKVAPEYNHGSLMDMIHAQKGNMGGKYKK